MNKQQSPLHISPKKGERVEVFVMKKGRRESVILAGIEQLCGRVRDFFAESLLLDGLSSAFARCEQTF